MVADFEGDGATWGKVGEGDSREVYAGGGGDDSGIGDKGEGRGGEVKGGAGFGMDGRIKAGGQARDV